MKKVLILLAFGAIAAAFSKLAKERRRPQRVPRERRGHALARQVREHIAGVLARPDAVRVAARGTVVTLRGRARAAERDRLIAAVLSVPGVTQVSNYLEDDEPAETMIATPKGALRGV
jgi:BON domain-containing protein